MRVFIGPNDVARGRVMDFGNAARRTGATTLRAMLLLVIVAAGVWSSGAGAAQGKHGGQGNGLPDGGDVAGAWIAARSWLDAFELPAMDDASAAREVRGATAVCLILRKEGRIVGEATESSGDALMLRRAAGAAMARFLGDPAVPSADDVPAELRAEFGRTLTLQLEIAGVMEPLAGKSFTEAGSRIEPGIHGIALRREDRWAVRFPSQMLAENTASRAAIQFSTLASDLNLPATDLATLSKDFNVTAHRFRTIQLAQSAPGASPFPTHRGDRVVELSEITPEMLQRMTDELAAHIATRAMMDAADGSTMAWLGVMDTYLPGLDQYRPLRASARDEALIAMAMARYAARRDEGSQHRLRATSFAQRAIAHVLDDASNLRDVTTCAAVVCAGIAARRIDVEFSQEQAARLREALRLCANAERSSSVEAGASAGAMSIAAYAAAAALNDKQFAAEVDGSAVRTLIDRAWAAAPEHEAVGLLPWIGWAELELANALGGKLANADRMNELRELLWESQVRGPTSEETIDLAGGFRLVRGLDLSVDAHSCRPGAFLASMVLDERMTPAEARGAAAARQRACVRWLRQLQIRDDNQWTCRQPKRAVGGIRQAPWDANQPLAGQAMALLTLVESVGAVSAVKVDPGQAAAQ